MSTSNTLSQNPSLEYTINSQAHYARVGTRHRTKYLSHSEAYVTVPEQRRITWPITRVKGLIPYLDLAQEVNPKQMHVVSVSPRKLYPKTKRWA